MNIYNRYGFNIPPVVKHIIIINILTLVIIFINENFMTEKNDFMIEKFALFYPASPFFRPHQFVTHMFMHGSFVHLFFNMYAFWIFGSTLEQVWGGKKFFLYYMVTGLGAAVFHIGVNYFEALSYNPMKYEKLLMTPMVGASGAVFGILLAYGMLFPNNILQLFFPPVALKAKWLVIIYGALELVLGLYQIGLSQIGLSQRESNIAHFAHIGGMLFGFLLIKYWQRKGRMYW